MKKVFAGILVLFVAVVLAACSGGDDSATESSNGNGGSNVSGDVIRVGLDVDPGTMDPRLANDSSASRVTEIVFDGLVELDENLVPQPALAESWENPDELTYIFHLREDVTFHDGEPFTADDVKFTFDSILDESFNAPYRSLYEPIESVNVVDEYTVEIKTSEPYAPLLSYLNIGIVPEHLADNADFANNPVGTGPYKMTDWKRGSEIHFEANAEYFNGEPATEKIVYYIIPDNTTRVSALEAGDIDLLHSPVSPQDIGRIESDDRFVVHQTTGLGHTYLNFNFEDPTIGEEAVRVAISHAVNKESIANDIYAGMDQPGKSPLIPSSWAYTDAIEGYEYNPELAQSVLEDAGWVDEDGDGIRERDGNKLSVVLKTHTEDPNRMQAVEFLQYELQSIGIDTSVETQEWPSFQESMQTGDYQVALLGWLNLVDPDRAMFNQFHSEGGSNYGSYSNPEVDELLEKGRTTIDQNERAEIYAQAAKIVTEEVAYNVVLYQGYVVMHVKELEGFTVHPGGYFKSLRDAKINN